VPEVAFARQRMKRTPIPLHWQLSLACSALAAVLVFAVLALSERLLAAHFENVAEAQADDVARTLSYLFSRALDRRVTELQLLSRSVEFADLSQVPRVRAELQRLAGIAPIYRTIMLADAAGSVLATSRAEQAPGSIAEWPVFKSALAGASLDDTRIAGPGFVVALGLPLQDGAGQLRAVLVAELDWNWFRGLRDEILERSDNRTVLSAALFSQDGRALISDHAPLDAQALQASASRPSGGRSARLQFGAEPTRVLVSREQLPRRAAAAAASLGWQVVVSQDLDASLLPLQRLQRGVVAAGAALALLFSVLTYALARRVVRPYAGVLDALTARAQLDANARSTSLTGYLDALTAQLKAAPPLRGPPRARPGLQQPLEVLDMLTLIAEDASRLQALLDALPIGVTLFDGSLRVMYWNRHCEAITGWSAAEVVGRTPYETYAAERSPAEAAQLLERLSQQPAPHTLTRAYRRRDGSVRQCALTVAPERDESGRIVRILALAQDVTEQLLAEARQARHARDLSALARQLLEHEALITRRLAQTLHDRLGQTLSALRLTFDASAPAARETAVGALITQAVSEVREALVELRPPLLDKAGLHAALDNEVRGLRGLRGNPNRVNVTLASELGVAEQRYPADVEYAAFMIAREAIGNALRHGAPSTVDVRLHAGPKALSLEVQDDGRGFDSRQAAARPGHLGLVGMRERALAVGARLAVESGGDAGGGDSAGSRVRFEWAAA
jgi:PAS domain S-box-containing protein